MQNKAIGCWATERHDQTEFLSHWLLCGSWSETEGEAVECLVSKVLWSLVEAWSGVKMSEMGKVGSTGNTVEK